MNGALLGGMAGLILATTQGVKADMNDQSTHETATLGGGCFWCLEAVYEQLDGVHDVVSGYSGGTEENPTYADVCAGKTGHAEVIQITYDPAKIRFSEILDWFWKMHDPTTPNRQGNDVGPQYRSIILYHDAGQKEVAEKSIANAQPAFEDKIVTQLVPFEKFHPGEAYHQDYYRNNKSQGYCAFVIRPKLKKLDLEP